MAMFYEWKSLIEISFTHYRGLVEAVWSILFDIRVASVNFVHAASVDLFLGLSKYEICWWVVEVG